jgi:GNAT superfamily N-acetyltransferase
MTRAVTINPMNSSQVTDAIDLIASAMNQAEAGWAKEAFNYYFACEQKGIDSARNYYVASSDNKLCGLVGLHKFRWGPPDNVWLSWFAVHPDFQQRGIGSQMLGYIKRLAMKYGYKKLLVETYASQEFTVARRFYEQQGFTLDGKIDRYIDDEVAMLVYGKRL